MFYNYVVQTTRASDSSFSHARIAEVVDTLTTAMSVLFNEPLTYGQIHTLELAFFRDSVMLKLDSDLGNRSVAITFEINDDDRPTKGTFVAFQKRILHIEHIAILGDWSEAIPPFVSLLSAYWNLEPSAGMALSGGGES